MTDITAMIGAANVYAGDERSARRVAARIRGRRALGRGAVTSPEEGGGQSGEISRKAGETHAVLRAPVHG